MTWIGTLVLLIALGYLSKLGIHYSRWVVVMWFVVVAILLVAWRVFFYIKILPTLDDRKIRAVIVGVQDEAQNIYEAIKAHPHLVTDVVGYYGPDPLEGMTIPHIGDYYKALDDAKAAKFDLVYICVPMEQRYTITEIIKSLSNTTVSAFYVLPSDFISSPLQPSWHYIGGNHAVGIYESPHFGVNKALKRTEDLVFSIAIMLLIAVPMLLIALAVKLTSRGPIFFAQRRYGLGGKEFYMYKFRTMTTMDDGDVIRQASSNNSPFTPLGGILRKYSLDSFDLALYGSISLVILTL
jgi:putative colanic acid biosynthesis UDP-glucose lipid carrier transferase